MGSWTSRLIRALSNYRLLKPPALPLPLQRLITLYLAKFQILITLYLAKFGDWTIKLTIKAFLKWIYSVLKIMYYYRRIWELSCFSRFSLLHLFLRRVTMVTLQESRYFSTFSSPHSSLAETRSTGCQADSNSPSRPLPACNVVRVERISHWI